jgi:hypothetical protein
MPDQVRHDGELWTVKKIKNNQQSIHFQNPDELVELTKTVYSANF